MEINNKFDLSKFTYDKLYVKMLCAFKDYNNIACWKEIHDKVLHGKPPRNCFDSFKSLKEHMPTLIYATTYNKAINAYPSRTASKRNKFYRITDYAKQAIKFALATKPYVELLKLLNECSCYEEAILKSAINNSILNFSNQAECIQAINYLEELGGKSLATKLRRKLNIK